MFKFKGCPRCEGDIFAEDTFLDGWYEICLQCGYRSEHPHKRPAPSEESSKRAAKDLRVCGESPVTPPSLNVGERRGSVSKRRFKMASGARPSKKRRKAAKVAGLVGKEG